MPTKSAVFVVLVAGAISTYGQGWTGGTIVFNTKDSRQRITLADGVTSLAGLAYFAQLYASAIPDEARLAAVTKAYNFRSGDNAGYLSVHPAEQAVTVPHVDGIVYLQIRAWEAPYLSYESAVAAGAAAGKSLVWSQDTRTTPMAPPLSISGFEAFGIGISEPSIHALLVVGAAALLVARRR